MEEPPDLPPGPTAGAVLWRSLSLVGLALLCLPAIVLQAYVPYQRLWVAVWLTAGLVLVGLFFRGLTRARDLERAEVARGCTTMLQVARERPDLWLLDAETRAVLSAPGERRPPDLRRPTVRAWLAEREGR